MKRRDFLKSSLGAATASSLFLGRRVSANDKVVFGFMGLGGRGVFLAERFAQLPEVEVAYLCDVDQRRFEWALERVEPHQEKSPKLITDFRRMLDDPGVDAIVNATPDHWHALGTIMACQAGKDVYVEKPLALNIFEGQKMVEAARKYNRVVQVGTQARSSEYVGKAIEYLQSGNLGDIHMVRVSNMMKHPPREKGPEEPVPNGLDWEMWCGPAPVAPYSPGRWWFERWDYSCGGIAGDAIHQIDLARMVMGLGYPKSVSHQGGIYHFKDGREIPDTQTAVFEYDRINFIFEASLWSPYMKKTPTAIRESDEFPEWPFNSTRIEILGTEGFMNLGRHGGGWQAYDQDNNVIRSEFGRPGDYPHFRDFINCISTRERPIADVEEGHVSTLLSHLANVSYRVENQRLHFDPSTGRFKEDDANQFLKREYRHPWVVPDKV